MQHDSNVLRSRGLLILGLALVAAIVFYWTGGDSNGCSPRSGARETELVTDPDVADNAPGNGTLDGVGESPDGARPPAPDAPATVRAVLEVRDGLTRSPLRDAEVRTWSGGLRSARTGADGRVKLEIMAERWPVEADVSLEGYVGRRVAVGLGMNGPHVVLLMPENAATPMVQVVRGIVVADQDLPVPGASVVATTPKLELYRATTDASGRFHLSIPRHAFQVFLFASHGKHGDGAVFARANAMHEPTNVDEVVVRLADAVRLPLRLSGAAPDRVQVHVTRYFPSGDESVLPDARDGDSVPFEAGVWSVWLGERRASDPLTPRKFVYVSDGVAFDAEMKRSAQADRTVEWFVKGAPIRELEFDLTEDRVRIRVIDERGAPVPGATVVLEPSDRADPFVIRYKRLSDADAARPGGLGAELWHGRRASPHASRRAMTDTDGRALFVGWIPRPTLVWVSNRFVPDHFEAINAIGSSHVVRVRRGGSVRFVFPSWLDEVLLRGPDGAMTPVWRSALTRQLSAGTYEVLGNVVGAGPLREIRNLVEPVVVEAGKHTEVDLRDAKPAMRLKLRLVGLTAESVACSPSHRPTALAFFDVNGEIELSSPYRSDNTSLDLRWGRAGVVRTHAVSVSTLPSDLDVVFYDLSYERHTMRIAVTAPPGRHVLTFRATGPQAPHCDHHTITAIVPGGESELVVADVPAGAYDVWVVPPTLTSLQPKKLTVPSDRISLALVDESLEIVLKGVPKDLFLHGVTVTAKDLAGRASFHRFDGKHRIRLSGLAPGAYTIEVLAFDAAGQGGGNFSAKAVHKDVHKLATGNRRLVIDLSDR